MSKLGIKKINWVTIDFQPSCCEIGNVPEPEQEKNTFAETVLSGLAQIIPIIFESYKNKPKENQSKVDFLNEKLYSDLVQAELEDLEKQPKENVNNQ